MCVSAQRTKAQSGYIYSELHIEYNYIQLPRCPLEPCSEPLHNIFNIFSRGGCGWLAHIAMLHGCQSHGTINAKLDFKTLISYQYKGPFCAQILVERFQIMVGFRPP